METVESRRRNRRGEGARLRDEILAAATGILEETGSEEAITLRSVARAVGIAAPSIYAHFPDRESIVDAVVDAAFEQLRAAIRAARPADPTDPVDGLLAGCLGYAHFALERPARYRILFARTRGVGAASAEASAGRVDVFQDLVNGLAACVRAGRSDSTDPFADATAIWCAMHGAVTLRTGAPAFPWPPVDAVVADLVHRLGRLRATDS